MKGSKRMIVVYHSNTGFSRKYAQWIGDALRCDAVEDKKLTTDQWNHADKVIYGGGMMAGKIQGFSKIRQRPEAARKLIAVFAVGATPKEASALIEKIPQDNFTSEERDSIAFFYLEGGLNYEKMGFLPRKMLKMMSRSLEKKHQRTAEEDEMLRIFESSHDRSNEGAIFPLVEYVKSLERK